MCIINSIDCQGLSGIVKDFQGLSRTGIWDLGSGIVSRIFRDCREQGSGIWDQGLCHGFSGIVEIRDQGSGIWDQGLYQGLYQELYIKEINNCNDHNYSIYLNNSKIHDTFYLNYLQNI